MKKLVLLPFLLFIVLGAFAQHTATVSGQILNAHSQGPLPYATVTIAVKGTEALSSGAIADDEGRFVVENVSTGNYMISVSFVGYVTKEVPLLIGELNHNYDLGKIRMAISNELPFFYGLFFLYGLYAAATESVAKAWITNITDKKDTATAIGTYTGFQSICAMVASTSAGWIWLTFGAPATFLFSSGVTLVIMVYILVFVPHPQLTSSEI